MANYDNYEIEDFLQDDSFIDWILNEKAEGNAFWTTFLSEHPEKRTLIEKARAILISINVKPLEDQLSDTEINLRVNLIQDQAFRQIPERQVPMIKIYQRQWFKTAAIFLIFITIGFISYQTLTKSDDLITKDVLNNQVKISNTSNKSKLVLMNDGSLAVLTPGSEIQFPSAFKGEERNVYLQGEAFFEVHKDHKHPFLVHSQNMITRVLGTSFTVKAFKNAAEFRVIVNTGKVWVYDQKTKPAAEKKDVVIALSPNQQVTYKRNALQFKKDTLIHPLLLSKEVAVKELNFTNIQFSTVISKLNEAYGIQIEYNKQKLGDLRITALLAEHPLNEKVELICRAVNAKYRFADGRIIIEEDTPTNK
ncbi:FecR family protein [Mucilaginibacter sp.]|jgi:ferric-dicitrate binding protein FerR (iron transport regulator)|uniref:FecR family protein n=1 Tax=Mucilaginibacter sp. TaxID=1882438 RepID=UPI00356745DA